jgi:hypothetical protein
MSAAPKPASAPWMRTDIEDPAPTERDRAHAYVELIGREHARLRARLGKLERPKDSEAMGTNQLAMNVFNSLAEQVRKDEPHLTREQAFAKAYRDPKNVNLRRIERNSFYKSIDSDRRFVR